MSLIVQEYIKNYTKIRYTANLEDESYNNLLSVENCIAKLYKNKSISDTELKIMQYVAQGYNYLEISKELNLSRMKVSNTFRDVCARVAFVLGVEFTDSYLEDIYYGN